MASIEKSRLQEIKSNNIPWKKWGPYLSERQWGTVREDYSEGGDATWSYFPHDHARSRAYRWGEDGLLGICDRQCRIAFALALWNGRDRFLKERLFGLTGPQGNHGEDVKECYWYEESTPTHSYTKALYKYPQCEFPYAKLAEVAEEVTDVEAELEADAPNDQSAEQEPVPTESDDDAPAAEVSEEDDGAESDDTDDAADEAVEEE